MKKYIILAFLLIPFTIISASEIEVKEILALTPKIGYGINLYSANFNKFQSSADCGVFEFGYGYGLNYSLFLETKFSDKEYFSFGISYIDRSGSMSLQDSVPKRYLQTGSVLWAYTTNKLIPQINFLEFSPEYRRSILKFSELWHLRAIGGLRFFIPLTSEFEQYEEITSPTNIAFKNSDGTLSRTRDIASGAIEDISRFGIGFTIGIENLMKSGKNSNFTQELLFDMNFTDYVQNVDWKGYAFRLNIGYRFEFDKIIKREIQQNDFAIIEKAPEIISEPQIIKRQEIKLNLFATNEMSITKGKELLSTTPIVNSVFFDQNSSLLSDDYKINYDKEINYFDCEPLEAHKYILPRIADIIKNNKNATVEIIGATSGKNDEPKGEALALERANIIKEKLIALKVLPTKINTVYQMNPDIISNKEYEQGLEENRRADILVYNAPIQEYVDFVNYSELKGMLDVEIQTKFFAPGDIINVKTNLSDQVLTTTPADLKNNIFRLPFLKRITPDEQEIEISVEVWKDSVRTKESISMKINKINVIDGNYDLSRFKAFLRFDYNSSKLSIENKELLTQLISKLPKGSKIEILGSADALGSESRNSELTTQRALTTKLFINEIAKGKFSINTGVFNDKFNESTPQGRFLNRCIVIKIED